MRNIKTFFEGSKYLNSIQFIGHYDMNIPLFLKLLNIYNETGNNYLDDYSSLIYLKWELKGHNVGFYTFEECEKYNKMISIAKKYKLFNLDDLGDLRRLVQRYWINYRDYLDKKRNEPRKRACRFTAMSEVKRYIFTKYGNACLCCGSKEKISLDHVTPIHKGGKDEVENLQPLCKSCNSKKGISIIDYRHE